MRLLIVTVCRPSSRPWAQNVVTGCYCFSPRLPAPRAECGKWLLLFAVSPPSPERRIRLLITTVCRLSSWHQAQNVVTDFYCLPSFFLAPRAECGTDCYCLLSLLPAPSAECGYWLLLFAVPPPGTERRMWLLIVIVCRLSSRHRAQIAVTDCYCLPSLFPAPAQNAVTDCYCLPSLLPAPGVEYGYWLLLWLLTVTVFRLFSRHQAQKVVTNCYCLSFLLPALSAECWYWLLLFAVPPPGRDRRIWLLIVIVCRLSSRRRAQNMVTELIVIVCRLSSRHRAQKVVTDCYCLPSLPPAPSAECGYWLLLFASLLPAPSAEYGYWLWVFLASSLLFNISFSKYDVTRSIFKKDNCRR